jgi:hypothetical protein
VDLRELAETYVRLEGEIAETRRLMLVALSNGRDTGKEALKPRPAPARPSRAERMATARAAETRMIELLKERPMGPTELARMTGANRATVADRLTRLRDKGLAEPCGDGGMARRRELTAEEAELCAPSATPPHEVWVLPIGRYMRRINYRGERIEDEISSDA